MMAEDERQEAQTLFLGPAVRAVQSASPGIRVTYTDLPDGGDLADDTWLVATYAKAPPSAGPGRRVHRRKHPGRLSLAVYHPGGLEDAELALEPAIEHLDRRLIRAPSGASWITKPAYTRDLGRDGSHRVAELSCESQRRTNVLQE